MKVRSILLILFVLVLMTSACTKQAAQKPAPGETTDVTATIPAEPAAPEAVPPAVIEPPMPDKQPQEAEGGNDDPFIEDEPAKDDGQEAPSAEDPS